MAQSKWERGFWASVREKDHLLPNGKEFKPYPPSHWYKKKTNSKKRQRKPRKGEQLEFSILAM